MTDCFEIYRCEVCGNIVQVLHSGAGELVCCGKPMLLLKLKTGEEEKQEKHVPVFLENGKIQIGSIPHPMTEEHHIEFVQALTADNKDMHIHFFDKTEEPKVNMNVGANYNTAIEYCNLHGLWQGYKK